MKMILLALVAVALAIPIAEMWADPGTGYPIPSCQRYGTC